MVTALTVVGCVGTPQPVHRSEGGDGGNSISAAPAGGASLQQSQERSAEPEATDTATAQEGRDASDGIADDGTDTGIGQNSG